MSRRRFLATQRGQPSPQPSGEAEPGAPRPTRSAGACDRSPHRDAQIPGAAFAVSQGCLGCVTETNLGIAQRKGCIYWEPAGLSWERQGSSGLPSSPLLVGAFLP